MIKLRQSCQNIAIKTTHNCKYPVVDYLGSCFVTPELFYINITLRGSSMSQNCPTILWAHHKQVQGGTYC